MTLRQRAAHGSQAKGSNPVTEAQKNEILAALALIIDELREINKMLRAAAEKAE